MTNKPTTTELLPERVWIRPLWPQTLEDQLHDGGIWRYEGGPDDVEFARASANTQEQATAIVDEFYYPDGTRKLRGRLTRRKELELLKERIASALNTRTSSPTPSSAEARERDGFCWKCAGDLRFGPSLKSVHVILDRFPSDHLLRRTGSNTAPVSRQVMAHEVLAARIELALLEKALQESFELRLGNLKGTV